MALKGLLSLLVMVGSACGFSVVKHSPADAIRVKEGDSFTLMCAVDNYYEWCTFQKGKDLCDFEWKRSAWNVTMQDCAKYQNKVAFQGDYEKHECGLKVMRATASDSGTWYCDVEEYIKMGSRGSGSRDRQSFTVTVYSPTTPPPTTPSAETTTVTTTVTTSESTTTTEDVYVYPEDGSDDKDYYVDQEDAQVDHTDAEDSGLIDDEYVFLDDEVVPANATQAEEFVGEEEDDINAGLPVGLSICIIVVFATLVTLFALHYKRRLHPCFYRMVHRPWKPVMNAEEFPVTDDEEKNHPSIIKNGTDQADMSMKRLEEETMNITADLTTVSWVNEEKPASEENAVEDVEDSKLPSGEDIVEKEAKTEPTEETPLQDEENLQK